MAKSNYSPMHMFAITKLFFLSVDCTHMFNISVNQLQLHSVPVSDTSYGVQPQKVHSGSFWGTFRAASSTKHQTRVALELIALRGENNFNPRRHQNRILAPLGGSFQKFPSSISILLYRSLALGVIHLSSHHIRILVFTTILQNAKKGLSERARIHSLGRSVNPSFLPSFLGS